MNTKIEYLYRDKMNYRILNTCIIPGLISNDQIRKIIATLRNGKMFIPRLVGLPEQKFENLVDIDGDFFELDENGFVPSFQPATLNMSADQLVKAFEREAKNNWKLQHDDIDEICIIVEKGAVQKVLMSRPMNCDIRILDLDTTDVDVRAQMEAKRAEIEKKLVEAIVDYV